MLDDYCEVCGDGSSLLFDVGGSMLCAIHKAIKEQEEKDKSDDESSIKEEEDNRDQDRKIEVKDNDDQIRMVNHPLATKETCSSRVMSRS